MAHQVSIWRAAQLVGVARGVLQQQVRTGALLLNDGMVSTEDLLRLYPNTALQESGLLERVVQIRDEAFGKRLRERLLPSQEVLAQRLFAQSQELGDVRLHLQHLTNNALFFLSAFLFVLFKQVDSSPFGGVEVGSSIVFHRFYSHTLTFFEFGRQATHALVNQVRGAGFGVF